MKKKTIKRLARNIRKMQPSLLGGNPRAGKVWREAGDLRYVHNLCLHGDDGRIFASPEQAAADKSTAAVCSVCGLTKLRVDIVTDTQSQAFVKYEEAIRLGLIDIVR
ncbi:MAG: hypothetical protein M3X11_18220 [Acidobacteriota bacterium]|nr:hypothetical protein [Acidobacteriota bacterium]